jgi:hypothetical protein
MHSPALSLSQKKLTTARGKLRVQGLEPYKDSDLSAFQQSKPHKIQVEGTHRLKSLISSFTRGLDLLDIRISC